MHWRRLGSAVLLGAALATIVGCAEQQDPINRVEAYALPKALFQGEWYYQQTVVDVPGTLTVSMVGNTNYQGMHRVRWDIQEGWLYARKAYEEVEGAKRATDFEGVSEDTGEYMGAITGAWRITKHFDIKRGYNPTTGEKDNTINENSMDCKWYDCQYIRVDWSTNHATEYMFLDNDEDIIKAAVPFYNQDNDPRWKPIFDATAGYMDITTSMAVTPGKQTLETSRGPRTYPICWLFIGQHASCNTETIKLRNSFWRRDPNRDYEPRLHQGYKDEWFGFFVNERMWWDSHYGLTNKQKRKFINRHNIWAEHHYADTTCTTDAECAKKKAGSKCDKYMEFHKYDVETDTDKDGLPDAYETFAKLDPNTRDSDGDGTLDAQDLKDGTTMRNIDAFWAWDKAGMHHRCLIPKKDRDPVPLAYFDTGYTPRDLRCDKDDKGTGPCKPWKFAKKGARSNWSTWHHIEDDYGNTFWRTFLAASWGWSYAETDAWVATMDPKDSRIAKKAGQLAKFGDATHGYYAFAVCPNNPVVKTDAWPCRFPHHSWTQAKKLIDKGLTFNTLSYKQAMALIDDGKIDEIKKRGAPAPRHGDIRYSNINYVRDFYDGIGLLGLGPSHTDPRTGENLAGVANVYVLNDWAATYVQELVQLLSGDISPTDYVNGVNLENWVKKINPKANGASPSAMTSTSLATTDVTPKQMSDIYDSMVQPWMKRIPKLGSSKEFDAMTDDLGNPMNFGQLRRYLINQTAKSGMFDPNKAKKMDITQLKGTSIEKRMIDSDVLMASGFAPGQVKNLSSAVLDRASPARHGFIKFLDAQEDWRFNMSNRRNMYFLGMADDAMVGLAYRMAQKYKNLDKAARAQKVWEEAREMIMRAVTTHEMGHTVGLHHNWAGSEDVLNFHPEYWNLRTNEGKNTQLCTYPTGSNGEPDYSLAKANDGKLCPFYIKNKAMANYPVMMGNNAAAAASGKLSLYEYSYSSVMDYAGRYNIDHLGLGRYDQAAIIYGHGDAVEVYKDVGTFSQIDFIFDEWYDSAGSILMLYSNRASSFHYTSWYSQLGKKVHDETNRMLIPWDQVNEVQENGRRVGDFFVQGNKRYPRVPYLFCTYTRGDISDGCNTRDFGADQYERMKMHIDTWDTWYTMRSFTRYNYPWDASKYVARYYRRTYKRLKNFNNSFALYQGLFRQWYTDDKIKAFFSDPVNGYGAYTIAIRDSFNMALRTLAMPDVKGYQDKAKQADGQTYYSEAVFSSKFRTDLSNARYFATSWSTTDYQRTCGLAWWDCLHHVGFYLDKMMAIEALTDASTYFVAKDTAEDIRQWRISYFNNFTTQLIDFFGSVLSHDYDEFAPWFDPAKPTDKTVKDSKGVTWVNGVAWRNYVTPSLDPKKPSTGAAVEASTRFTLQLYMLVYGMTEFHQNFDNEFVARARMWKKGMSNTWDLTATKKITGTTKFVDPYTGVTFVGVDYVDNKGVAERMIGYANKLKGRTQYCTPKPATGTSPADVCDATVSAANKTKAESDLYDYTQLLDILVQLTKMYDSDGKNWHDDYQDA